VALCLAGAVLLGPSRARAGFDSQLTEVVQVMKEAMGSDAALLAARFGFNDFSALALTLDVDGDDRTFRFATLPGTMYLGMLTSIETTGAFDVGSGVYTWTSNVSWGSESFTALGSMFFVGDPDGESTVTIGGNVGTLSDVKYSKDGTTSTGRFRYVDAAGGFHSVPVKDTYNEGEGTVTWVFAALGGQPGVQIVGQFAVGGGGGAAVMNIGTSVPEPASVVLMLSGLAALSGGAAANRRRRRGR
jgi:hypothetical protein